METKQLMIPHEALFTRKKHCNIGEKTVTESKECKRKEDRWEREEGLTACKRGKEVSEVIHLY